jgi:hypothetical protein
VSIYFKRDDIMMALSCSKDGEDSRYGSITALCCPLSMLVNLKT